MKLRAPPRYAIISLHFLLQFISSGASAQTGRKLTLNIHGFGALGDGKTKGTAAIRQALGHCSLFGGCEVLVPAAARPYSLR